MQLESARRHIPRLVQSAHALERVHGKHAVGRFNAWLAVTVTRAVGSMWCAYAFVGLALVSLPAAIQSGDRVVLVSWVSQTFLQLVLLSVIIVGQNVQSAASDSRAQADHETLSAIHTLSVAIHDLDVRHSELLEELSRRMEPRAGGSAG